MLIALTMPQFGESITQARIVHWLKKEGDTVAEQEPLVEMETEKAVFSYESPFRGKIVKVLEKDEAEAPVGKEIAHFEVSEEDGKKYLSLGIGKKISGDVAPEKSVSPSKGAAAAASQEGTVSPKSATPTPAPQASPSGSKLAPLIRSLAKEHGLSIEEAEKIPGTGPGGRVTKEDFLKYMAQASPVEPIKKERIGVRTIPLAPIRARIAENMVLSKQKIPHAGCSIDVDLTVIEKWRAAQQKPPGYLAFTVMAALKAVKNHAVINSSFKETEGKKWIEQYDFVHLGLAVATEQGLMVPVIHNAHERPFKEIVSEIERLVDGARKGTLKVDDLTGATFTINNVGAVGAVRAAQIVPYPQGAILALNRAVRRPWAAGDNIEIRTIMSLDIAFDHRIIDGDRAGRFLVDVAKNLENFDFSQIV